MAGPLLSPAAVDAALARKARLEGEGIACPYRAAFVTVARQPEYLHATLRSFVESDPLASLLLPVTLMVGGTDDAYARPYAGMGLARVVPMTPAEAGEMNARPMPDELRGPYRYLANLHRTLARADPERGFFVFEDDVSYTRDWFQKFTHLSARHPELEEDDFLFSFYSCQPLREGPEVGAMTVPEAFFGNQGLYFPRRMRAACAEAVGRALADVRLPGDLVLRDYCLERGLPIFLTRRSLIQHEGNATTGLSQGWHRSPTFEP